MPVNVTNPVAVGLATKKDHFDRAFENTVALYGGALALTSQAQGAIPYASSASQLAALVAGGNGQVLTTRGPGANPVWGPSPIAMAIVLGG